jgi:hypothetical protein
MTVAQAARILGLTLALLLVGLSASELLAQKPWLGWNGPLADGIMDFRFGMDRRDVRAVASRRKITAAASREETLRYTGSFLSAEGELVLEFTPDARRPGREQLTRIRLEWVGIGGGGGRPKAMFDALSGLLEQRYGPAAYRRDASISDVSTGFRNALHVYEGPEMQAQLSLSSAGSGSLRLMLVLISPQLDPELAG